MKKFLAVILLSAMLSGCALPPAAIFGMGALGGIGGTLTYQNFFGALAPAPVAK